jgi:hypothetical protein
LAELDIKIKGSNRVTTRWPRCLRRTDRMSVRGAIATKVPFHFAHIPD